MAKRPIVVDTTTDSPLAAIGVHLAKDVPIPKASAPGLFSSANTDCRSFEINHPADAWFIPSSNVTDEESEG